jgi:hypothetical protein
VYNQKPDFLQEWRGLITNTGFKMAYIQKTRLFAGMAYNQKPGFL